MIVVRGNVGEKLPYLASVPKKQAVLLYCSEETLILNRSITVSLLVKESY